MSEDSEQTTHSEEPENENAPNFPNWLKWAVVISLGISIVFILGNATFLIIGISAGPEKPESLKLVAENPVRDLESSTFFTTKTTQTTKTTRTTSRPTTTKKLPKICKTPECFTLAQQLMSWKNPEIDPCEDFHEFTCGRFVKNSPAETVTVGKMGTIYNTLQDFIQKPVQSESRSENELRFLYKKCREVQNWKDLKAAIPEILAEIRNIGKFPLMDKNWKKADFDLNSVLQNLAESGMRSFGLFYARFTGKILLIQSDFTDQKIEFSDLKKSLVELAGIKIDVAYPEYSTFFDELHELKEHKFEKQDFSVLKSNIPSIDFEKIIQKYIHPTKIAQKWPKLQNRTISLNQKLFGNDENLEKLIARTDTRILANYLFFRIWNRLFADASYPKTDEDKKCVHLVNHYLPRATLRVFVRHNFKKENLKIVSEMIEDIRDEYVKMFRNSTWMDDVTRQAAVLKAEKIRKIVGYGEEYEPEGTLDRMYEELETTPDDSYFTTVRKIETFRARQEMDLILSESSFNPFHESYLQVNAFYLPEKNEFTMFVPYMADPFLDPNFPTNAKIAGIGPIIGHEIGHGFDSDGKDFDEKGNQRDWWTPGAKTEYTRRTKCFEKSYDDYDDPVHGKNLNGTNVIHEVLADAMGTRIAWNVYKKWKIGNDNDDPIRLIGFEDYDADKLYFQMQALQWCALPGEATLESILHQSHPVDRFRVNGVLRNFRPFSDVFQCKKGSYMNPDDRCDLF